MARNLAALIVDPNGDSRLDVTKAVESIGFDAAGGASYGTEALVLTAECSPNVVLMALEDPPVRGLATLEALQQSYPDIPVVVYSSDTRPSLMRQAMRSGARDYLEKPLGSAELREAIFAVLAQEEQRQLARWAETSTTTARGTVLTLAGAKGGIGKTTVAVNLAVALRAVSGQEVALVDADAQFGDVGVMLDIDASRSIADLCREQPEINRDTVQDYLVRHESGVDLLVAASEPDDWRAVQPEQLSAIVRSLAETHEYVLVDTPGTMNELVAAALAEADVILLLTSLDVSSIKDTRTAVRILEAWDLPVERVRLVVNDTSRAQAVTAADVKKAVNLDVAHVIPNDQRVGISVQTGIPIVGSEPRSRFSREVTAIAEAIAGVAHPRVTRMPFRRIPLLGGRLW